MQEIPLPKILSKEVVHKNPFYEVHRIVVDLEGHVTNYYVQEHGARVGIVVTRGEDVLLVKQYRFLVNRFSMEIPGGSVATGETPEAAARRECLEETGVLCSSLKPLHNYQVGLDIIHNPTYLFYSDRFTQTPGARVDTDEVVGQQWVPIKDCLDMVWSGQIADSFSIIALLLYDTLTKRP